MLSFISKGCFMNMFWFIFRYGLCFLVFGVVIVV